MKWRLFELVTCDSEKMLDIPNNKLPSIHGWHQPIANKFGDLFLDLLRCGICEPVRKCEINQLDQWNTSPIVGYMCDVNC